MKEKKLGKSVWGKAVFQPSIRKALLGENLQELPSICYQPTTQNAPSEPCVRRFPPCWSGRGAHISGAKAKAGLRIYCTYYTASAQGDMIQAIQGDCQTFNGCPWHGGSWIGYLLFYKLACSKDWSFPWEGNAFPSQGESPHRHVSSFNTFPVFTPGAPASGELK